jgi:hypothetical protein
MHRFPSQAMFRLILVAFLSGDLRRCRHYHDTSLRSTLSHSHQANLQISQIGSTGRVHFRYWISMGSMVSISCAFALDSNGNDIPAVSIRIMQKTARLSGIPDESQQSIGRPIWTRPKSALTGSSRTTGTVSEVWSNRFPVTGHWTADFATETKSFPRNSLRNSGKSETMRVEPPRRRRQMRGPCENGVPNQCCHIEVCKTVGKSRNSFGVDQLTPNVTKKERIRRAKFQNLCQQCILALNSKQVT